MTDVERMLSVAIDKCEDLQQFILEIVEMVRNEQNDTE